MERKGLSAASVESLMKGLQQKFGNISASSSQPAVPPAPSQQAPTPPAPSRKPFLNFPPNATLKRDKDGTPILPGLTITGMGKIYDPPMTADEIQQLLSTTTNQIQSMLGPQLASIQNIQPQLQSVQQSATTLQSTMQSFPQQQQELRYGAPWPGSIRDPMFERLGQNMHLYQLYQEYQWKANKSQSSQFNIVLSSYMPNSVAYEEWNRVVCANNNNIYACGTYRGSQEPSTIWVVQYNNMVFAKSYRLLPSDYPGMQTRGIGIHYMAHPSDSTQDWILVIGHAWPINQDTTDTKGSKGSSRSKITPVDYEKFQQAWKKFHSTAPTKSAKSSMVIEEEDDSKSPTSGSDHWICIPLTLDFQPHPVWPRTRTKDALMKQYQIVPISSNVITSSDSYQVSITSWASFGSTAQPMQSTMHTTQWTWTQTGKNGAWSNLQTIQWKQPQLHSWIPVDISWKNNTVAIVSGMDLIDNVPFVSLINTSQLDAAQTTIDDVTVHSGTLLPIPSNSWNIHQTMAGMSVPWPVSVNWINDDSCLVCFTSDVPPSIINFSTNTVQTISMDNSLWKQLHIHRVVVQKTPLVNQFTITTVGGILVARPFWFQPGIANWILDSNTNTMVRRETDPDYVRYQRSMAMCNTVLNDVCIQPSGLTAVGTCQYAIHRHDTDGYVFQCQ